MCNCDEIVLDQMLEKMKEEYGFTEVLEAPMWKYYSIYPDIKPYFPIVGKYLQGKKSRKFSVSMYLTFCPFCGKLLGSENKDNENI
jgi:hypothetical protein